MQSIVDLVWTFMASLQFTSFLTVFLFAIIQLILWCAKALDNFKVIPIICGLVVLVFSTCFLILI